MKSWRGFDVLLGSALASSLVVLAAGSWELTLLRQRCEVLEFTVAELTRPKPEIIQHESFDRRGWLESLPFEMQYGGPLDDGLTWPEPSLGDDTISSRVGPPDSTNQHP